MRVHRKCVPQNRALLNAQVIQCLPDYRGRGLGVGKGPARQSVTHGRYARNLPLQQETFARKCDPAVSTTLIARRFSAKNELRIAGKMSCQPGQFCIWTIAWLVVGARLAPWVEQVRQFRRQSVGQKFGQFVIRHRDTPKGCNCGSGVLALYARLRPLQELAEDDCGAPETQMLASVSYERAFRHSVRL